MYVRAAADVSLAYLYLMRTFGQVDRSGVATLVDQAGIVNHRRAVDRDPSRVVDLERKRVVAGPRCDQLAAPDVAGRKWHRTHRGYVVEVELPIDSHEMRWVLAALLANVVSAEQSVAAALHE